MPWVTIAVWIVSFLLSYATTEDAGLSALLATGAAAAAYYTIEPTNPDSVWGDVVGDFIFGEGEEAIPVGDPTTVPTTGQVYPSVSIPAGNLWSFASDTVGTVGAVAESWGPVGTLGVAAGVTGLLKGYWWVFAAIGAVILLK
jgi:hypothetical protein